MRGMVVVPGDALRTEQALGEWVTLAVEHALRAAEAAPGTPEVLNPAMLLAANPGASTRCCRCGPHR